MTISPNDEGAPTTERPHRDQRSATNVAAIVPQRVTERTIDTRHGRLHLAASPSTVVLAGVREDLSGPIWSAPLTIAEAMELARTLLELADDQRQDAVGRAWSRALLSDPLFPLDDTTQGSAVSSPDTARKLPV
jgi:hypothetical protein